MVQAVFHHKIDSIYDDITGEQYHFPRMHLSRVEQAVGDWIVYCGPIPRKKGRFYSGVAKVASVRPDPGQDNHFYAELSEYLDFDRLVDYSENGGYERKMFRKDGSINGGTAQNAVRLLTPSEFAAIINAGLANPDEWPDRIDPPAPHPAEFPGLSDQPQTPFVVPDTERPLLRNCSTDHSETQSSGKTSARSMTARAH